MKQKTKDKKKGPITRADRNTPEAAIEENPKPYDEIGKTDEEIRRANQADKKRSDYPGPVPTEGS